jgi:HAD superfamily hydrolase (TIGR01509 family)
MVTRFDISLSPEELARRKQAQYVILLQDQMVPRPGLKELLESLQKYRYKKAIASSSTLNEIEAVINALHIATFIDGYCSSEQVSKGKPAPDIFLLAAEKLGVKPQECLVLEDGTSGIDAAIAAKMFCYAIPSRETKNLDFSKANRTLGSLAEVSYFLLLDSNLPATQD